MDELKNILILFSTLERGSSNRGVDRFREAVLVSAVAWFNDFLIVLAVEYLDYVAALAVLFLLSFLVH